MRLPSLRGATRRGNPAGGEGGAGLLRFARNDGWVAVACVAFLVSSSPLPAQSQMAPAEYAYRQLPDPKQEAKAAALMQTLRCLVCQGQSIADSDAEMAGDMRSLVRRRIEAGEEPDAIRNWLIQRYGNWISYDPPVEPVTWPLWIAPVVLLAIGAFLARGRFRRRRG